MIIDLLESYKAIGKGKNLAIDSHKLKDGLYVRLYKDGDYKTLQVNKNTDQASEDYIWFKNVDFKSNVLTINKAVDTKKKIHSNNIYSVFFKCPKVTEINSFAKRILDDIKRYYEKLQNQLKDTKDDPLLKPYDLSSVNLKRVNFWRQQFTEFLPSLYPIIKKLKLKQSNYIKLFADVSIQEYENEYLRYTIPKIYNKSDYNCEVNSIMYGLSNNNMGLNSKKPYLEHKTTNFKVPFRITTDQALKISDMFNWLENQYDDEGKSITTGYIDSEDHDGYTLKKGLKRQMNAHVMHIEKGKYAVIGDYDFIPGFENNINFNLRNYLDVEDFEPRKITDISILEKTVDKLMYKGQMRINYFSEDTIKPKEWFTNEQIELLLRSREAMYTYFRKGSIASFKAIFDDISLKMVKYMLKYSLKQAAASLNLRLSMLAYLKIERKAKMGNIIRTIRENLINDLVIEKKESIDCKDDDIYYYIAGQIASYLLSKSQAQKVTYSLAFDLINARNIKRFKYMMEQLFLKYGYDIDMNPNTRFNKMFAAYNEFTPQDNIDGHSDSFMAGLSSKCIIYFKEDKQ